MCVEKYQEIECWIKFERLGDKLEVGYVEWFVMEIEEG